MVFGALFYLKYISNQDYLLQEEALAGVILEERKYCNNILLQAPLKNLWSSAKPKLKKNKFVKTLSRWGSY